MKTRLLKYGMICLGLLASAYGYAQSNTSMTKKQKEAKAAIENRIKQFVADFKAGNGEGFADIFSDSYLPEEQKKGLIASIKQMSNNFKIDYEITINEIKVDLNMAYEMGWYRTTLTPKGAGEQIIEEYEFLDVWEKETDGVWKITRALKTERPSIATQDSGNVSENWALFLGAYEVNGAVLEVIVNDQDQLQLLSPNQPPLALEPIGENSFRLKGVSGASVTFEAGENGSYETLRLKQVTGELVAKKK